MKAVKTRYSENRLKGLLAVGSLALLSTGSKNFLQSVNTDIIQVNAEKQAKAGFNAKIVRRTEPNCCSWCASLAGTYTPEEAKAKGIYARHEGCVCAIDFYPSKRKRQRISNYMKDAKTQEKLAATSSASDREERIALAKTLEEEKSKRTGKNEKTRINTKEIYSEKYTEKLNRLGESAKITAGLRKNVLDILKHRDGTEFEDLIYIDSETGKVMVQKQYDKEKTVKPTKAMEMWRKKIKSNTIIGIHNHPSSTVPSYADLKTAYERRYKYGVVVGHNGVIYKYSFKSSPNIEMANKTLDSLQKAIYNDDYKKITETTERMKHYGVDVEVIL